MSQQTASAEGQIPDSAAAGENTHQLLSPQNSDSSKQGPKSTGAAEMRDTGAPSPIRSAASGSQSGALSRTPSDPRSAAGFPHTAPANYPSGSGDWGAAAQVNVPRMQPRYPADHQSGGGFRGYNPRSGYGMGERRNFPSGPRQAESQSTTNLYIKGLDPDMTDARLVTMCEMYGAIVSTKAILDPDSNKCKGYGFVDFENAGEAAMAVRSLSENGVQAQMARQQEQDLTNLYIANLPEYVDETYLESMVQPYGTVVSVRILKDLSTNRSRGVGFCRMQNQETCQRVINELNRKTLPNALEPLLIKFADSNRKRTPRLLHENRMPMPADNMNVRFSMPGAMGGGPTAYMSNMGNWAMYPPMTLSPHASLSSTATNVDPSMLASQLSHMQISGGMAHNYPGPPPQANSYPTAALYPSQMSHQNPYGPYEISHTPPAHMMASQYDEVNFQGPYNPM